MDPSPSGTEFGTTARRPEEPELPPVPGLRLRVLPAATFLLLGYTVFILGGNYLPTRAANAATSKALEDQRVENHEMAGRIRRAETEAEALRSDPWRTERILRDELHFSRPGEVLIR